MNLKKVFVTRKLLGVPFEFGSWQDEDAVIAQDGQKTKDILDDLDAWSYIIPCREYHNLLEEVEMNR